MSQQAPSETRIALVFEKFSSFVEGYASNLSMGGMFLETDDQRPEGSIVDFEIKLKDGFRLIQGLAEVVWRRPVSAGAGRKAGMAVRFQALDDEGRELILKVLEERVRAGMEPFDVEQVPEDLLARPEGDLPAAASDSLPPGGSAGVDSRAAPLDVEQKILGEDGFTLHDKAATKPGPGPARTGKGFQEFDAPWGENLPELPREVLEEDPESTRTLAGGATQDDAAPAAGPQAGNLIDKSPVAESPAVSSGPSGVVETSSPELDAAIPSATMARAEAISAGGELRDVADEDSLDESWVLAAEAADEIDLASTREAVGDPDFDEIDFSVSSEDGEDRQADSSEPSEAGVGFAFEPDPEDRLPSSKLSEEFKPGETAVDFAFEPDPEDQLPPLELMAEAASSDAKAMAEVLDDEDPTFIVGSAEAEAETVLTSEPLAAELGFEAPGEDPGAEIDLEAPTMLTSEPLAEAFGFEAPSDDPGPSPAASSAATEAGGQPPESWAPEPPEAPGLAAAPVWAPDGTEPLVAAREPVTGGGFEMPAGAAKVDPGESGIGNASDASSGAATITVAGAPVAVQDYEDDLFAEEPGAGSGQVVRQALSGRSLAVGVLLLALAVAGYFYRGPLAELLGLAGPVADAAAKTTGRQPSAVEPGAASSFDESPPPPTETAGATADTTGAGVEATVAENTGAETIDAETTDVSIETVDVSESLPSSGDISAEPEAEPDEVPPTMEVAAQAFDSTTSPASRVERISFRRSSGGTLVTVMLDGDLAEDRHVLLPLGYDPAKELIKITGIDEPYVSGLIAVGLPEIKQIRVGHHTRAGASEIHMVFDYPSVGPKILEVRNFGDRLEILIAGGPR